MELHHCALNGPGPFDTATANYGDVIAWSSWTPQTLSYHCCCRCPFQSLGFSVTLSCDVRDLHLGYWAMCASKKLGALICFILTYTQMYSCFSPLPTVDNEEQVSGIGHKTRIADLSISYCCTFGSRCSASCSST